MTRWQADRIVISTTRSSGLSKKVSNYAPELSMRIGPFHNNPRRPYPSKEVAHMLSRGLPVTLVCEDVGNAIRQDVMILHAPELQGATISLASERPSVRRVEVLSQSKAESPVVENVSQNLGPPTVEKGRVGGVEVEMVIDSGATISLIPKALWKNLVKSNGKDWEKRCAVEAPNFKSVFTANNQPMKLIHQVKLETSLKARTREVVYHVADVERESVILGTNAFDIMGISMNIQGVPREVKLTRDIRLVPGSEKTVEVLVE
uniref:Peptidase A2 domain-containing protein n=1 Tax=Caenorhabditis japonica TaxID=281687 RepID=A0A8R1I6V5_CAEJA